MELALRKRWLAPCRKIEERDLVALKEYHRDVIIARWADSFCSALEKIRENSKLIERTQSMNNTGSLGWPNHNYGHHGEPIEAVCESYLHDSGLFVRYRHQDTQDEPYRPWILEIYGNTEDRIIELANTVKLPLV